MSVHHSWLLDRAMALLDALMVERDTCLVYLPPEGIALDAIERAALVAALDRSHWVQKRAAELLRISPRIMHYKIRIHGLTPPEGYPPWRNTSKSHRRKAITHE